MFDRFSPSSRFFLAVPALTCAQVFRGRKSTPITVERRGVAQSGRSDRPRGEVSP
jgi:hypothetical protein